MSVLIKGMEMPTTCMDCNLSTYSDFDSMPYCDVTAKSFSAKDWRTRRDEDCPLIYVEEDE